MCPTFVNYEWEDDVSSPDYPDCPDIPIGPARIYTYEIS